MNIIAATATVLALTFALVACGPSQSDSSSIERADIADLPTPTGGEIFTTSEETQTNPEDTDQIEDPDEFQGTILQDLVAENPEIGRLARKVRSGQATAEETARLEAILSERFGRPEELGPFGFDAQPVFGSIESVQANSIEIEPYPDEQGLTPPITTITIADDTEILVASENTLADLQLNETVDIIATRDEDGIITARTITLADFDELTSDADAVDADGRPTFNRALRFGRLLSGAQARPPGAPGLAAGAGTGPGQGRPGRGGLGARFAGGQQPADADSNNGAAPPLMLGDDAEGIPAQGRITKIEDNRLHIETEQGPLRVTLNDETALVRISSGQSTDITEDQSAWALATSEGNALLLLIGPQHILELQTTGLNSPVP